MLTGLLLVLLCSTKGWKGGLSRRRPDIVQQMNAVSKILIYPEQEGFPFDHVTNPVE